jgi:hypothetical protein
MKPDRQRLLEMARERVQDLCVLNAFPEPSITIYDTRPKRGRACGHYDRPTETISIWLPSTAQIGTAGRAWSYPGYLVDRTPTGVLAHELGHHWHMTVKKDVSGLIAKGMMIAKKTEGPLSGYEPDPFEVIAEAFRVFVWNPQLLGLTFPRRYETLITYGLKPLPMSSWRDPLRGSPRHILAAEAKIRRALREKDRGYLPRD